MGGWYGLSLVLYEFVLMFTLYIHIVTYAVYNIYTVYHFNTPLRLFANQTRGIYVAKHGGDSGMTFMPI